MDHIKYPSINQFRQIVKSVRDSANWNNKPAPTITFECTPKVHGCMHGSTLVSLADGSQKQIKDLSVGELILAYNIDTSMVEVDAVTHTIVAELEKDWCELTFDSGASLKCTIDHPVLTTIGYIAARDLDETHDIIGELPYT